MKPGVKVILVCTVTLLMLATTAVLLLPAPEAAAMAKSLEGLTSSCDPATKILEREGAWARKTFGCRWRFIRILRPRLLKAAEQNILAKYSVRDSTVARLASEASARAALK